jgi:hypothetical protein
VKVIQPNCRIQFTAEDVAFIADVLGKTSNCSAFLTRLLADPESRDLILDDEMLFRALLEQPNCLRVSSRFYFYVLVRHVLRHTGIKDRTVADYVAELLTEFSREERSSLTSLSHPQGLNCLFEMLAALETADDRTAFCIRAHIGNHSLFLSGVFPDRIRYRSERRGAPDLKYYEQLGRMNYRVAGGHKLAQRYELAPVFDILSAQFDRARMALNDLSERIFSLGDAETQLQQLVG